jgi:hypothetical protein
MRVPAVVMVGLLSAAVSADVTSLVPAGWHANCGDRATGCSGVYTVAVDHTEAYTGAGSVSVSSRSNSPSFGGVNQIVSADAYRGKRLRYTAGVKTDHVAEWTGLWLRVARADGFVIAFDNMNISSRALRGDRAWSEQSVVLDVPQDAAAISFGVVLSGNGKVWIDTVRLDSVGSDVAVTGPKLMRMFDPAGIPQHLGPPHNLDFED